MFELRWLERVDPDTALAEAVLQYRCKIDTTLYAGNGPYPQAQPVQVWSDWRDVQRVSADPAN
jgi:hypothetical protein